MGKATVVRAGLLCLALILCGAGPAVADADLPPEDDAPYDEAGELYQSTDYRLARPGQRPVGNFYNLPGFASVDPGCLVGGITLEMSVAHPVFPASRMYFFERIRMRPRRTGGRFPHRFTWEITSDPFQMAGITTVAEGGGSARGRVWVTLNVRQGIFRVVTDVTPREGVYRIDTSGPGISRSDSEDYFFGLADHHYAYVDLSGLRGGGAATAAVMPEIEALLRNRPPNVVMGFLDWARDGTGASEGALQITRRERMALSYHGVEFTGLRSTDLRVVCGTLLRQYERLYGRD